MYTIYHDDALARMRQLPDKSIDHIITDPPYGITQCRWDSVIPLDRMWIELERIIKPGGNIVLFGSQPFTSVLVNSNLRLFKYELIWDKHIPRNFINAKIMPMKKHENILIFGKGKTKYNPQMIKRDKPVKVKNYAKQKDSAYKLNQDGSDNQQRIYTHRYPDTIIQGYWEANRGKLHPTQKPVLLIEYLIKTFSDENEIILDFAMGSGTTGIACKKINRQFIGIELNKEYFEIAEKRINESN